MYENKYTTSKLVGCIIAYKVPIHIDDNDFTKIDIYYNIDNNMYIIKLSYTIGYSSNYHPQDLSFSILYSMKPNISISEYGIWYKYAVYYTNIHIADDNLIMDNFIKLHCDQIKHLIVY